MTKSPSIQGEKVTDYIEPEVLHKDCPVRYSREGIDYCGASDTPCEYCVERKQSKERSRKSWKDKKREVIEDVYD